MVKETSSGYKVAGRGFFPRTFSSEIDDEWSFYQELKYISSPIFSEENVRGKISKSEFPLYQIINQNFLYIEFDHKKWFDHLYKYLLFKKDDQKLKKWISSSWFYFYSSHFVQLCILHTYDIWNIIHIFLYRIMKILWLIFRSS